MHRLVLLSIGLLIIESNSMISNNVQWGWVRSGRWRKSQMIDNCDVYSSQQNFVQDVHLFTSCFAAYFNPQLSSCASPTDVFSWTRASSAWRRVFSFFSYTRWEHCLTRHRVTPPLCLVSRSSAHTPVGQRLRLWARAVLCDQGLFLVIQF